VREFGHPSLGLAGSLLIAHPNLLDPNFRRTILFLSANDPEDGSVGLVLNRETSKKVADFVPDKDLGILGEVPVFIGGPVGQDQIIFASFHWSENSNALECRQHLEINEALEVAEEDLTAVRAFVGYSGWSQGQLEAELVQKAWLVQKPDRDILDLRKCRKMWTDIMRTQGPWLRLLAVAPDDPSLN
jgi:putative transcriptional regulator